VKTGIDEWGLLSNYSADALQFALYGYMRAKLPGEQIALQPGFVGEEKGVVVFVLTIKEAVIRHAWKTSMLEASEMPVLEMMGSDLFRKVQWVREGRVVMGRNRR